MKKAKKKKAPEFKGLTKDQRRDIEAVVEQTRRCPVNMTALLNEIEQCCHKYAPLLMDRDLRKFFVAEKKRVAKFRQQLAEEGRLPPVLYQDMAEIERFWQQRIFQLDQAYTQRILGLKDTGARSVSSRMLRLTISSATPSTRSHHTFAGARPPPDNQNARMAPLDAFCLILLGVWLRSLGGDYWEKGGQAAAARFIAVCTKPVEAETSTNEPAISHRLHRLEKSGVILWAPEGIAPENPYEGHMWWDVSEAAGGKSPEHGQTQPD